MKGRVGTFLKAFKPTFWSSFAALLLFALLITLGFWQLHRYHYKQDLLRHYHSASESAPITLTEFETRSDGAFQHIDIQGRYIDDKTILLDNRWYHHQLGYEVLTPVRLTGEDKAVLVNRGWVPAPPTRQELPVIKPGRSVHDIIGYVNLINPNIFILGENVSDVKSWPIRIQKVDVSQLSQLVGIELYPFVLRLDVNQPNGFVRNWEIVNVLPQRHLGYAVQWFLMAFTLVIAFFAFSWKRRESNEA